MSEDVVIVSAARTAIGGFLGGLSSLSAAELGKIVITENLKRAGLQPSDIDDVIMGQVLTAAVGQNPARQAAILAGIPHEKTAYTLNQVCGSGLRAVALAAQSIRCGDASIVLAGGQESMSNSPHAQALRNGHKMGDVSLIDTMIKDGLWDAFNHYHMGITAENVAKAHSISREAQDAFALASQQKAAAAQAAGNFKAEIVAVTIAGKKGDTVVDTDEHPRASTTLESLQKLKPAFDKAGSVTAGNASGINDGAAAVIVMSAMEAKKRGLTALARIASWATTGVDPAVMGTGPISASQLALKKAGWTAAQLDRIEANEAFAAQACAVNNAMGWDMSKVNVNGGAIALGHPIGASGCRVLVTLLHELKRSGGKKGIATLCIGGGMGIALCVEAA
ncbi:MAG: acetyl-CoA C-acetyltransferase [Alphaproteobacteria bacterium]|jgi:acetyl-CoA C-acetyltransferase|nr:acetyl-CoA C-acetyltransferase [Thalassospira sp.]MCE2965432.1 acetyl-CoA C-acetyltransferase [Alphaproteobacteria bacterium]